MGLVGEEWEGRDLDLGKRKERVGVILRKGKDGVEVLLRDGKEGEGMIWGLAGEEGKEGI